MPNSMIGVGQKIETLRALGFSPFQITGTQKQDAMKGGSGVSAQTLNACEDISSRKHLPRS